MQEKNKTDHTLSCYHLGLRICVLIPQVHRAAYLKQGEECWCMVCGSSSLAITFYWEQDEGNGLCKPLGCVNALSI